VRLVSRVPMTPKISPRIDGRPQQNRPARDVISAAIALPFVPGGLVGR
jgi:hypothetical protein